MRHLYFYMSNGKGSKRRPSSISDEEYESNYNSIFRKDKIIKKEKKQEEEKHRMEIKRQIKDGDFDYCEGSSDY